MENLIVKLKQGEVEINKEYNPTTPLKEVTKDFESLVSELANKSIKNLNAN